ncbi:diacylglycerol/lipid kinase family protein [Leucobacter luti]|uniref:diacylglycerol/lipid kinase family protein n=1 Tax=Leucobacter luti TaxID=340320 RepID=UPI003D05ED58
MAKDGSTAERIGIVWNPSKTSERELRSALEEALAESVFEAERPHVSWFETTPEDPGHGAARSAVAAGCGLVIAAGGDGTVRAVAEELGLGERGSESGSGSGAASAELGIVPLGTGNLLARNLGVPLGNPQAAFARALESEAVAVDLGEARVTRAGGEDETFGFVVMVGFGVDAQMIVETDDELKARSGWLAYVESLGRAISGSDVVEFELSVDGGEPRREQSHTLLVANCGTLQAGITLLPDASPSDGVLDVLMLSADDVASWLDTMRNMVWDNGLKRLITRSERAESSDSTAHLRAGSLRVELPEPREFEVDGEEVGEVTGFEVRVHEGALRIR